MHDHDPRRRRGLGIAKAVAVACAGVLFAIIAIGFLLTHLSSRTWPSTTAVITKSSVASTGSKKPSMSHRLGLSYTYDVNGTRYTGHNYLQGRELDGPEADMRKLAAEFPVGTRVIAIYDPAFPGEVFLVRESAVIMWLLPLPGVLMVAIGAVWAAVLWRMPSPA